MQITISVCIVFLRTTARSAKRVLTIVILSVRLSRQSRVPIQAQVILIYRMSHNEMTQHENHV